ncbi:MAG TPA: hypothetical protein VLA44_05500 [Clostridia bacterium]|nr:hypothetical protein [Clostridia bacterium]
MNGQRKLVGARKTYFPPFVNERFDGPPWWACTFTALLNGVNVGYLGSKPATHREVRALATASGDVKLRGGSNSSEMVRALRVRYGQRVPLEQLTPKRAQERLASGWALVAAVTYGRLPKHHRRWSKRFMGGHRITLIGWDGRRTMILDPLATEGPDYTGEPIAWSDFEPAWWSSEQLWIAEGMFRQGPSVRVLEQVPKGTWRIPGGSTLVVRMGTKPQVLVRNVALGKPASGRFDSLVELVSASGKTSVPYLRCSSGSLKGMLVPATTRGIRIRPTTGRPVPASGPAKAPAKPPAKGPAKGPAKEPAKPTDGAAAASTASAAALPKDPKDAYLKGRREEWIRLRDELGPVVNLPPPP